MFHVTSDDWLVVETSIVAILRTIYTNKLYIYLVIVFNIYNLTQLETGLFGNTQTIVPVVNLLLYIYYTFYPRVSVTILAINILIVP